MTTSLPLFFLTLLLAATSLAASASSSRPNILWVTAEDHGPLLGAYGDEYAHTPNLDAFAERGFRYDVVWSNAPVCAPARTTILTGLYATTVGAQHMRSDVRLPAYIKPYPQLLRDAGYYCTNDGKEDYNVSGFGKIWDDSSRSAHYKNRPEGSPFFASFNFADSHEGRLRQRTDLPYHDPDQMPVPPYHPDTPEVRRDWAQHYNGISQVDARFGELMQELEASGLADDTIVFYYADHGSGMPGHKRWPHNRGLHVPLIIHVPDKFAHLAPAEYKPGGSTRRPVAFIDLAPTLLSLAGAPQPEWMPGTAIMGPAEGDPGPWLFGFRGRMDERFDRVRSVRGDRYVYIRNYMPHLIYGQYLAYMFQTETTQIWERLYREGKLDAAQRYFWEPKPEEELYDLVSDPHEIHNLANSSEHQEILGQMRAALRHHIVKTRDTGFLPEAEMHRRAGQSTIYEMAQDPNRYPLERILAMAELAARRDLDSIDQLRSGFTDSDPAVRWWAITGIQIRGPEAFAAVQDDLRRLLDDPNPSVTIAAASVLTKWGTNADVESAVDILLQLAPADTNGAYVALAAVAALADLPPKHLERIKEPLRNLPLIDPNAPKRPNDYVRRHVSTILSDTKSR